MKKTQKRITIILSIVTILLTAIYGWWRWSTGLLSEKPYQTEQEEVAHYMERHFLLDRNITAEALLAQYRTTTEIVQSLHDPYSELLLQEELDQAVSELNGSYVGVGFEAKKQEGAYLQIIGVMPDSPAMKAGLRPNDMILTIDGADTKSMDSAQTLSLIKGPEGTVVSLTIRRENADSEVQLHRTRLDVPIVESRMLSETCGYLSLSQLPMMIYQRVEDALHSLSDQGMNTLVLDLRGNSGGEIEEAAMVASLLLPEDHKELFTVSHKTKEPTIYQHTRKQVFSGSLYVLVNEYTASSAELLAEILRDVGDAVVIGAKTFGKGISQSFFYLESGNILKLTTGQFYAPGGHIIHENGVVLNYDIPMDPRLASTGRIHMSEEEQLAYVQQLRPYFVESYGEQEGEAQLKKGDVQLSTAMELAASQKHPAS